MSESNVTETFTVVAFRYDQKKSVLYVNVPTEKLVSDEVFMALRNYNADVISIRRVYEKCPKPNLETS